MTNKPNFTPGPWEVESDPCAYDTLTTVTGGGSDRVLNLTRELIVEVGGYAGYETAEANAALIAAAPEMYSCLEEAIAEMCKDCPGKKADACNLEDGECIANKWINTLKKARGEK